MFKDRGHGHIDIPDNAFGFVYKCFLPKIGYGINAANGEMQETDIIPCPKNKLDNFWQRPLLPADFKAKRAKEKSVQQIDPKHIDPYLEQIRRREWKRRLCGIWFYNYNPLKKETELHYITGLNYFYITYWKFQGKHMDFRICDKDLFYVVAYCMEDPDCLGLNELTKRKNGKTARVGCWAYERLSRINNHHAALQSKSDDDAADAFKKAVIHPWQKLPDFFRPRYDLMKGEEPSELRLFATARRGSKAEIEDDSIEEPLDSFFDYFPSGESAADGPEIHSYISDEAGKTKKPVSIKERQNVVRYCTEIDGVMKGKHWQTTTVEPDKGETENYEFYDVTKNSNPLERNKNNRTGTGLYTYFLPAQKGMFDDKDDEGYIKYGFANEAKNLEWLQNEIDAYLAKNDTRGASSFKRKNARTFKEAFSADGETALYDPELINEQLDKISWGQDRTEIGNLVWKDGYEFERPVLDEHGQIKWYEINEVIWEANPMGKYEKVIGWWPKEPNKIVKKNGLYIPNNTSVNVMGCDPFKYDKAKDKRRSDCAMFNYQMPDEIFKDEFDDYFTIRYVARESSTKRANADVLKMAWLCGGKILFERNVNHWKDHFTEWNCGAFLMYLPGEDEPGIYTDGQNTVVQTICNYTEAHIKQHIGKVMFKTLMRKETGWLDFKVEETQKFDEPMAAGFTLIAVKGMMRIKKHQQKAIDIELLMPYQEAV